MKRFALMVALLCSSAFADPVNSGRGSHTPPTPSPAARPAPTSAYRFDVSITGVEAAPTSYHVVLVEGQRGELSSGSNIPYSPDHGRPVAREDLGMDLHLRYTAHGSVLFVDGDFQAKTLVPSTGSAGPTWSRFRAGNIVAPVAPDKPTVLASGYDVATHHHYEVTITAHKLH